MSPLVLNELLLLSSARFDSQSLLCIVLAGDARLMTRELRQTLCDHAAHAAHPSPIEKNSPSNTVAALTLIGQHLFYSCNVIGVRATEVAQLASEWRFQPRHLPFFGRVEPLVRRAPTA